MALTAADKKALEVVVADIENAASWHTGARESQLLAIADKVRAIADGQGDQLVADSEAEDKRQAEIEEARLRVQAAQEEAEAKQAKAKS